MRLSACQDGEVPNSSVCLEGDTVRLVPLSGARLAETTLGQPARLAASVEKTSYFNRNTSI